MVAKLLLNNNSMSIPIETKKKDINGIIIYIPKMSCLFNSELHSSWLFILEDKLGK